MESERKKDQSLREQSAWLLVAKVIGFACSFVLPLIIVRILTQDAVGQYRQSFQVITNAIVILSMGVSMSSYYYLARETERRCAAILNILIFNVVIGGIACLVLNLYPQLIGNVFRSEELTRLTPKIGVIIWVWMISTFIEVAAIANREVRVATVFIVASQLSKTVLMAGAVLVFGTVEAFIYAAMVQGVIQSFILLNYLRSRFPGFWREFDAGFFREQMAYAIPYGFAGVLWIAQTDLHNYFVGNKFSPADYAVYAYGCFDIPLIAMLTESVTSVLIPKMNALHVAGDRDEMIRLTARATHKLSLFYFPLYAFLLVTAGTFITTLFTERYEASIPIFMVNLTLLPFGVLINDPVIRSYKELGRVFLIARIFILVSLIAVLYYGLGYFGLTGMITTAVAAIVVERCVAQVMVIRTLKLGREHIPLTFNVGKTALASAIAGLVTYLVYSNVHVLVKEMVERFVQSQFAVTNLTTLNLIGGMVVMALSAMVFLPIYLVAANLMGLIEDEEKETVKRLLRRFTFRRPIQVPEAVNH